MRKLETINDLLDALGDERGWTSSYRIAKELGVPESTVGSWRRGTRTPGDDHALMIAHGLDISPALVLTIAAVERSKGKATQKVWRELAKQLARGVVSSAAVLFVASGGYAPPVKGQCAESVYSVKSRRRRAGRTEALQPAP